jgi:hypothetical protein
MQVEMTLKFPDGAIYMGKASLDKASEPVADPYNDNTIGSYDPVGGDLDYTLAERAFFKKYVGALSGPKKFVLAVAYLAKGEEGLDVELTAVRELWKSVEGVMGGACRGMYKTRAVESPWIHLKSKEGKVSLRMGWAGALS